jgi:ABC-type antimicrobial peptide transport system permease subunit
MVQDDGLVEGAAPKMLQVIGVVPGVRVELFDPAPMPHLYLPYTADAGSEIYLHLRTTAPTAAAEAARLPDVVRLARALDPALPVLSAETRASLRDRSPLLGVVRTGAQVFTAFGLCALALAAVGVYAVKAYVVARRTREIGIRVALGATRASVLGLVAGDGLLIGAGGLAVGAMLAVVVGRGLRSMTYAARGADLPVMTAAIVVLLAATALASVIPARRAARIDPSVALRE